MSRLLKTVFQRREKHKHKCNQTCYTTKDPNNILSSHSLPQSIVSNYDVRFLSQFWCCLWRLANTTLNFSSAYHPQTDGQTEVVNCSLGKLLWSLVSDHLKSWDQRLYQAEFAYNRSVNRSTRFSPLWLQPMHIT